MKFRNSQKFQNIKLHLNSVFARLGNRQNVRMSLFDNRMYVNRVF